MSDEDVLYMILEDMEAPIDLHTLRLLLQRDDFPNISWEDACRINDSFRESE